MPEKPRHSEATGAKEVARKKTIAMFVQMQDGKGVHVRVPISEAPEEDFIASLPIIPPLREEFVPEEDVIPFETSLQYSLYPVLLRLPESRREYMKMLQGRVNTISFTVADFAYIYHVGDEDMQLISMTADSSENVLTQSITVGHGEIMAEGSISQGRAHDNIKALSVVRTQSAVNTAGRILNRLSNEAQKYPPFQGPISY